MTQTDDWGARLDAVRPELAALAAAIRRLTAAAVSLDAPREVIADATAAVTRVADALEAHVPTPHPPRYTGSSSASEVEDYFPFDPIVGRLSPLAPPIRIALEGERAVGVVTFGVPYEGPPGCVHGGMIAATFDQVFNVANLMRGVAGPTRKLEVRYLKPTPLGRELRFEAWVERVEGREVHTHGRIVCGDRTTVEAEGTFVQLSPERVMRLLETPPADDATFARDAKAADERAPDERATRDDSAADAASAAPTAREPSPPAPPRRETPAARRRRFRQSGDGT